MDGMPYLLSCNPFFHYYVEMHKHTVHFQNESRCRNAIQNPEVDTKQFMCFSIDNPLSCNESISGVPMSVSPLQLLFVVSQAKQSLSQLLDAAVVVCKQSQVGRKRLVCFNKTPFKQQVADQIQTPGFSRRTPALGPPTPMSSPKYLSFFYFLYSGRTVSYLKSSDFLL